MKKITLILCVMLMALPAMGNVVLKLTDNGDGTVTLGYDASTEPNVPRAFALEVTVTDGTITDVVPFVSGISEPGNIGFGIFPGTIQIDTISNSISDAGTPVADVNDPDNPGQLNSSSVVLEMGSLYSGDANQPATTGNLATIAVSEGTSSLSVGVNSLRGGVILENGTSTSGGLVVDPNTVTLAAPVCVGNVNGDTKVTTADITALVQYLDDNKYVVSDPFWGDTTVYEVTPDKAAWMDEADVNGDNKVTTADITALVQYLDDNKYVVSDPFWGDTTVYEVSCN